MSLLKKGQGLRLYYINKIRLFSLIIFLILILFFVFSGGNSGQQLILSVMEDFLGEPFFILGRGLAAPLALCFAENYGAAADWNLAGEEVVRFLTGVVLREPYSLLCVGLNLGPGPHDGGFFTRAAPLVEEEGGEEDFYLPDWEKELADWLKIPEDEFPPVQLDGEPMLLLYTTHNAESYRLTQGVSRLEGENGGIAAVSAVLQKTLEEKHRLKTIYNDTIHDYPDFNRSYYNSRQTAKKLLQEHPQIQVVLDLHRDAGLSKRADTLVRINQQDCAKILIVVGTAHAHWQENLAFAQKIEKKANELYPDLIKAVRLYKNKTYNQDLHNRSLLLEFGSDLNKEADAVASAQLLADVLAAILAER